MEKQKRWQFYLILAVITLTVYNILPTIFYYSNPLRQSITEERAGQVKENIAARVNDLKKDSVAWIKSFSSLIGITPSSITVQEDDPRLIAVSFAKPSESSLFKRLLPRAGSLIPFAPQQLELYSVSPSPDKVFVARQVGIDLDKKAQDEMFLFTTKYTSNGGIAPLYQEIVYDRATELALQLGSESKVGKQLSLIIENQGSSQSDDMTISLAKEIVAVSHAFPKESAIAKRFFASFGLAFASSPDNLIDQFLAKTEALKIKLANQKNSLEQQQNSLKNQEALLDSSKEDQIAILGDQIRSLEAAHAFVSKNKNLFKSNTEPLSANTFSKMLADSKKNMDPSDKVQVIDLKGYNPFIEALAIDWDNNQIDLKFYDDVAMLRSEQATTEQSAYKKAELDQLIINDIAKASSLTDELLIPQEYGFSLNLSNLAGPKSFLVLDLGSLARKEQDLLVKEIGSSWLPTHQDLSANAYPLMKHQDFQTLSEESKQLGLVVYAPAAEKNAPEKGFRPGSIYVIAKNLHALLQKSRDNASEASVLNDDVLRLNQILQQMGFISYPGSVITANPELKKDYIFELSNYYAPLLKATREDFSIKGSKKYAVLDFTDVEQRILTENRIEDQIQEDLVKWHEEYHASQVALDAASRYLIPAPTKNVYLENLKLSFSKYFRGDDRKILKWGLDLSGGKTVRIGLRDRNNRPVTNPDDIKQAVNELYTRINNMGVAERTIRVENNHIVLDFPGSQNLSATDLIQSSAMYFHIINEKFSPSNPALREAVNQFLQNVWNEAVVTNRKDPESINLIAWQHLGGAAGEEGPRLINDYAKQLYASGLRLANPKEDLATHEFNDTLSAVAVMRGDEFTEWNGQSHPLVIIFHNYALEGASLTGIQVGYSSTEGNNLSFEVKSSYEGKLSGNPRNDFYAWTSQFAEDKIAGTSKAALSGGHGWRMAVILNGKIISSPALRAALRDSATISGRFSQREVNQLAADLKAGSLSFTPKILSEENVSPELGKEERTRGIFASVVALVSVVAAMTLYYRFAGLVASCAVLFNLLIMWGVLQNLGAALTLPGIAGIVLTIGMAVDANVLVFERIREEFKISGRIASAIQAGYRKAFSAIVDSNITTIIAAIILIQFDSGPIKGFAVTLIIGILSSMFTALFMTRYFFAGWVQNPNNKSLSMSQLIGNTSFNFLAYGKKAIAASLVLMLIGGYFFFAERKTMFGMDFTGGYSLNVELVEKQNTPSYRVAAQNALLEQGASSGDVMVRELNRPNQLRIQLATAMEEKGHPFYQLPTVDKEGQFAYEYQKNPRLAWVVEALGASGLQIQATQLASLNDNWSVVSGQFSDTMRSNAIIALSLALLSILVYITFRFEFKYAIAAVVGLIHDVLITLGVLAIFHKMGFGVQIDLQVIGAIMTIIGYSLNDTIIIFDRIREDLHVLRKMKYADIINHALNVTLSRTLMTSGTTLLVLLSLVFLGGHSIFAFSLVMAIGVIVGTISSLFIASPVLLYFHNMEVNKQKLADA